MFIEIKKNKRLYMLVVEQINFLIKEGRLLLGDKLPSERDLAIQFGLSRSSIREAIIALEIMGFVDIQPGLGTFITNKHKEENGESAELKDIDISPSELAEARLIIEPMLGRLAAQRATKDDLNELLEVIRKSENINNDQLKEFEDLDRKFHLLIAKIANNEILFGAAESINIFRKSKLWGSMKRKSIQKEGRIDKYKYEHREIFDAIANNDMDKTEIIINRHLQDIKKDIFE